MTKSTEYLIMIIQTMDKPGFTIAKKHQQLKMEKFLY